MTNSIFCVSDQVADRILGRYASLAPYLWSVRAPKIAFQALPIWRTVTLGQAIDRKNPAIAVDNHAYLVKWEFETLIIGGAVPNDVPM